MELRTPQHGSLFVTGLLQSMEAVLKESAASQMCAAQTCSSSGQYLDFLLANRFNQRSSFLLLLCHNLLLFHQVLLQIFHLCTRLQNTVQPSQKGKIQNARKLVRVIVSLRSRWSVPGRSSRHH